MEQTADNMKKVLEIKLEEQQNPSAAVKKIAEGLKEAAAAAGIRCITIMGTGRTFLTGQADKCVQEEYKTAFDANKIPVIAAVNGACSGVGTDLLERADLAVASDTAEIAGYESAKAAWEAYAVNEIASSEQLEQVLEQYVKRLLALPEELISFGHKIYFAMEKLPDKPARSRYGAGVLKEIIAIQADLNQKLREQTGKQDPYSGVEPDEEICYSHAYDQDHAVLFEIRDDVEYIQLNQPRYRNMFDWRSSMELAGAYALANAVPTLKAIVVTGTGKRFHLGGIRHNQEDLYEQERFADQLRIRNQIMRDIKVPLISAVNGECSGGGMSLVLKSKLVVAAESARFGYPEIKHNGFACNSMVNTMGVIPKKAALKCFYYGDLFTAEEAMKFGIVHKIVLDGELEKAVAEIVKNLKREEI